MCHVAQSFSDLLAGGSLRPHNPRVANRMLNFDRLFSILSGIPRFGDGPEAPHGRFRDGIERTAS